MPIDTGDPWSDFLEARKLLIDHFVSEGESFEQITRLLSVDEVQIRLIHGSDKALAGLARIEDGRIVLKATT